ncbi:UvrD-helicase domain-containing protein [Aeromicrobium yanjiei]|uniref:DNA 3'-5' helicase n=1 Tax=Aeromicrobium yanjiei TaxID=2662028 RepID=A0A5Q2MP42_9ACTN|nr:UvrD-helicase domain-containing protein [Aeromicrobium yanjiei]QGG41840.1 AAA family ATPase [Aeromicrobium yanjiei]
MSTPLSDQPDRDRITNDTASTLFVNAGAGSGKTTALVDRIATLVLRDRVPLQSIAAVTFTEKAGAELRDRLRERFEGASKGDDPDQRRLGEEALDDLDGAAIGTLHAFAQRILMEHPIEASLPPLIEVLDEVGSSVAFEERWAEIQRTILDDISVREPLLLGMSLGMTLDHVRSLSLALGRDWDLIHERIGSFNPLPLRVPDLTGFLDEATRISRLRDQCTADDDLLLVKVRLLEELAALLGAAGGIEEELAVIADIAALSFTRGRKTNWTIPIDELREAGKSLAEQAAAITGLVLDQCLRQITQWVGQTVLASATRRRQEGRLEFHDLLVIARELLRDSAAARSALHDRYQYLLLDEFQDTDPIQIELAVRIAGGATADQQRWQDINVTEGRLFIVGDAKQSIYRFRRASVATYLEAQQNIGSTARLSTNFRTVEPILAWVNQVFGALIQHQSGAQPSYDPLDCHRTETGAGPAVTVLGATPHGDLPKAAASLLRERESTDVAGVVRQALENKWQVYDRKTKTWRDARPEDIAILVPARTSLPFLEDALEDAAIPYRAEASSLVYQASEVRSLLACARVLADSTDALALLTALRSPLFACGDDDLWHWKRAGGRISIYSEIDDYPLSCGPVGSALSYLRRLSFEARWMTPSEVLGRIAADRRVLEVAATRPRARDAWRRIRFVIDQARAWSEVSHGGLRGYLAWAAHQGQETSRVAEAVLPETDVSAVRIMTVHAAKGLEFPIVILSGMTSRPSNGRGIRLLWPPSGGYEVKLAKSVQTGDFEAAQPVDEQMDHLEKLRLLYVAATRARDHFVVSLHRAEGSTASTSAKLLADAGASTAANPALFTASPPLPRSDPGLECAPAPLPLAEWREWWEAAHESSATPSAISASGLEGTEPAVALAKPTDLESGAAKAPRDLELPPWSKGRYGSAVGRAVHAVLQVIDLVSGDGVEPAVTAQCVAEGVSEHWDLVLALVQSALSSEIVQRAASREHWRESYVGTVQDDGTILEGYVDLIYREDDGSLVIVDYKTDAVPTEAIGSRVAYYRPQIDAYVRCLESATAHKVRVAAMLLFLRPETAVAVVASGKAVEA